jgi:hypothetical protein
MPRFTRPDYQKGGAEMKKCIKKKRKWNPYITKHRLQYEFPDDYYEIYRKQLDEMFPDEDKKPEELTAAEPAEDQPASEAAEPAK